MVFGGQVIPIEITSGGDALQLGGGSKESKEGREGTGSLISTLKNLGVPRGLLLKVSTPTYLSSAARPLQYASIDGNMFDSLFEKMSAHKLEVLIDTDKGKDKGKSKDKDKEPPTIKIKSKAKRKATRKSIVLHTKKRRITRKH